MASEEAPVSPDNQDAEDINFVVPSPSGYSSRSDSEQSTDSTSSRKMSDVYRHYEYLPNEKKYKCKYCKTKVAKTASCSTSNLTRHLKSNHQSVLSRPSSTTPDISELLKSQKVFTQTEFDKRLVDFIISSHQPFLLVEHEAFKNLISYCNPKVNFMSKDTLKRRIVARFQEERTKLQDVLSEVTSKISFILDCWTSSNQIAFQGIIGRWVDQEWTYQERILDFDILKGSHTGANLTMSFMSVLQSLDLTGKIVSVTTDNASNCDTFFENLAAALHDQEVEFDERNQRVRCLAHIINLACQDALSVLKTMPDPDEVENSEEEVDLMEDDEEDLSQFSAGGIFKRLRKGIMKIRKSTQQREIFKKFCEATGCKHNELVHDTPTRWNSTYFMIKRAYKLKEAFDSTLRKTKNLRPLLLTEPEWASVSEIVAFLKPFKKMTTYLSHDQIPTMSLSVMAYMQLYDHLESISESNGHSSLMVEAARRACEKLNKYYPSSDGLVFVIGTVLDPRCKLAWYKCHTSHFPQALVTKYRNSMKSMWEKFYKPEASSPAPNQTKLSAVGDKPEDLFVIQMKKAKLDKRDELQLYLDEPAVGAQDECVRSGILAWWKARSDVFPNLSKMARDYLAVSGTGVPIERLFSSGTDLLSAKRKSMNAETVRMCLCLHGWMKCSQKEEFKKRVTEALAEKLLKVNV